MIKVQLRHDFLNKRKNIATKDRKVLDLKARNNLMNLNFFQKSKNIMTFVSFKDEIDTLELISLMIQQKKNVSVPITLVEQNKIIPSLINGVSELNEGTYGILEPSIDSIRPIDPNKFEIIIVPGLIFDVNGHRIGYGGGYYDRFLSELNSNALKIGFCYDFQLIEKLPKETFDVPVDMIITDKRIVQCMN